MPIIIDVKESAFYKRGVREQKHLATTNMLKDNFLPIEKIAYYSQLSIDEVLAIKKELDQKQP